jgi:IS5 family transposase
VPAVLRDRYLPADPLPADSQLDLPPDPQLDALDRLLDDELFALVRADLARRRPATPTRGRPSTPVEVTPRMPVVLRLYGWSYAGVVRFVGGSLALRRFCRPGRERPPHRTTLVRWARLIGPDTLRRLNDRAVQLARARRVTRGRRLRTDTTAVPTDIRRPCDSGLRCDGVRVAARLLRRARPLLPAIEPAAFRRRVRTARRVARRLRGLSRRPAAGRAAGLRALYRRLIDTAGRAAGQCRRVLAALAGASGRPAGRVAAGLGTLLPRLEQVIRQATRRVLGGEAVPAADKLLSLFEPHTQLVPRRKAGQPVEFGREVRVDEVEGGIVTGYRVVERGGGQDYAYLPESLANHVRLFGGPPDLLAADRGMAPAANERLARDLGVRRVALPRSGRPSDDRRRLEAGPAFRRGYRFRAGIEGRIHVLRRDYGLRRCRYHGEQGMGRWAGWAVVTHNLARIAAVLAQRRLVA